MTSAAVPAFFARLVAGNWFRHLALLSLAWAACLAVYHQDATAMVSIWWNASTFGHCLLIPLIIGWLVHQRIAELAQLNPAAWWPGLIWVAAGGLSWLIGDAATLALARHVGLVMMLQGAVVAALGPHVSRGLAFPLFYAFFLVPFGEELVPALQTLTARISMALLGLSGVPAHLNGVFITTPTGYFEVAEACSGAKFLIAMAAYAALVCNLCFKSWFRRAVFLLMSLLIAVVANGVRAFGTIYVAHRTSSDFAVGFDHVIYGWVFFALILTLVMAAGWPIFDRKAYDAFMDVERLSGTTRQAARPAAILPILLGLVALPPLWSAAMAAGSEPVPARITLPTVQGWTIVDYRPSYPWRPRFMGADHHLLGRYRNAYGQKIDLAIAVYALQEEGRELVGFGQGAIDPGSKWAWSSAIEAPFGGQGERIVAPGPVTRDVVSFYNVGGVMAGNAGDVKLLTLKSRIFGGDQRAVAVLVSTEVQEGSAASAAIAAFLHDLGPVDSLVKRSAGRK